MSSKKGLEALHVWRRSLDFAKQVYEKAIPQLPDEEKWGIASQLRRASVSVSANIAEGHGRRYYREGIRFCLIALGSLAECLTLLTLSNELGFLSLDVYKDLRKEIVDLRKMINGYINYLSESKRESKENYSARETSPDYEVLADESDWFLGD